MWCALQSWLSVMRFPLRAKGGQIPSWHPQMWNRLAAWLSSSADNSSRTCQLSKNELQQTNSRRVQNQGNHNDLAEKHACAHYRQPRGGQMGSQVAEWHFTFFQLFFSKKDFFHFLLNFLCYQKFCEAAVYLLKIATLHQTTKKREQKKKRGK